MMKNLFHALLFFFGLSCVMTSCSTIEEVAVKKETKSRTIDFYERKITKESIYEKPLVADLEVAKQKSSLSRTYEKMSVSEAKSSVSAEFAMAQNCDVIIHPIYETISTQNDSGTVIDITVTGYPAFYRNIKNFEAKDENAWHIYSFMNSVEDVKKVVKKVEEPALTEAITPTLPMLIPKPAAKKIDKNTKTRFGLSADLGLLDSPDELYFKSGIGGSMIFIAPFSKSFGFTMNASYLNFAGKYVGFLGGNTDPFNYASANLGFRYTSPIFLYAEARAGYGSIMIDDGFGNTSSEGGLNYTYSLGFHYRHLDISARTEKTKNIDFTFTGLRLGIYF